MQFLGFPFETPLVHHFAFFMLSASVTQYPNPPIAFAATFLVAICICNRFGSHLVSCRAFTRDAPGSRSIGDSMKFRSVIGALFGLYLTAGAAIAQTQPPQADLIKINIGGPTAGYFLTYVAYDQGIYQKHGLDPNFHWFTNGAPLLAALKSGSIDEVTTGFAYVFALGQNIPLKIISWEMDNSQGEGLMATDASGITNFHQLLKAKKIGAAAGTCSQGALMQMAKKASIDYSKLNVVNIPPPLFANAFTGGAIDAAVGWAPWTLNLPAGVKMVSWDSDYG